MTEEYDRLEEEARTVTKILIEENTKYNDMLKLPYVEVKDVVEKSMKDIKSLEKKLKRLNKKMDTIKEKELEDLRYTACMDILKGMGFEPIKLYPNWEDDDRIGGLKLKTKTGLMTIESVCDSVMYDYCGPSYIEITFEPNKAE